MSFSAREARNIIRKAVKRVPEGEEIRHLNIMPMMDMMTILLVAFIFQASVTATALSAGSVALPRSMSDEPLPENASTLIITSTAIVLEGEEIVAVRGGAVDAAEKEGGARGYKITKLSRVLGGLRNLENAKLTEKGKEPPKIPELLLIADRTTPFRLLFDVIYSAKEKEAGYKRFRLIVQKHEPIGQPK
ncbi:MAG: biopolymer transporter ExbD [Kofleriaceae bacterium]|nr:biopolymer transporter ExbD [Myxococcales bacterium]MCB9563873.1 biopolymer transporter ExbD [Kofleriaceae bacterium]MCB9575093.1 biopolymer transporter ExbD [Kofleriaceae bacterium]